MTTTAAALTVSTAIRMVRCGMRSAITPPGSAVITRPRARTEPTNETAVGLGDRAIVCSTMVTASMP